MDKLTAIELAGMTDKEIRIKIQLVLSGEQPEQKNTRTEPDYTEHLKRYTEANAAKVGQAVGCPWCGTQFTKKTYNHRFCCPAHKDEFWNAVKPERLEAKARKQRG